MDKASGLILKIFLPALQCPVSSIVFQPIVGSFSSILHMWHQSEIFFHRTLYADLSAKIYKILIRVGMDIQNIWSIVQFVSI
jgi:hypothetical protein